MLQSDGDEESKCESKESEKSIATMRKAKDSKMQSDAMTKVTIARSKLSKITKEGRVA